MGWPFSLYRQLQVSRGENEESAPSSPRQPPALSLSFLQSRKLRAAGSRPASPRQPRALLGTKATVTGPRVAVAPTSRGWCSWETVCTTSLMGWP